MTERRCHYATFIINTLKAVWAVLAAIVAIVIQSGTSEEVISEIGEMCIRDSSLSDCYRYCLDCIINFFPRFFTEGRL